MPTSVVPTERLLTTSQAAALVPVSERTLVRYAERGLLPYIRIPTGARRFRRADVLALFPAAS
jgi:excisionase family DNA binding protein